MDVTGEAPFRLVDIPRRPSRDAWFLGLLREWELETAEDRRRLRFACYRPRTYDENEANLRAAYVVQVAAQALVDQE